MSSVPIKKDEENEAPLGAYYAAPVTVYRKDGTRKWVRGYRIWLYLVCVATGFLLQRSLSTQNSWFVDALLVIFAWVGAMIYLYEYRKTHDPDEALLRRQYRFWSLIIFFVLASVVTFYLISKHLLRLF